MKIDLFMTIKDDKGNIIGYRSLSNPNAKHEYDISQSIYDLKSQEDYYIHGINNTMRIHKEALTKQLK